MVYMQTKMFYPALMAMCSFVSARRLPENYDRYNFGEKREFGNRDRRTKATVRINDPAGVIPASFIN